MSQIAVDLWMVITYPMEKPEEFSIKTNIKPDKVEEILTEYLHSKVGSGVDPSPRTEKDVYTIKIGLALAEDEWACEHDCGNKGLREGILMNVLRLLGEGKGKVE